MKRVGLIAGSGKLPYLWAKMAAKNNCQLYYYPLLEEVDCLPEGLADVVRPINLGQLDNLIKNMRQDQIESLVMIGKVEKTHLFNGAELDIRFKTMLSGLKELNDDSILLALIEEFEREGITVLKQSTYLEELFPEPGVLTAGEIDEGLRQDMEFGFRMAKSIGQLDIGQTVVVKSRAVLAVEAIEGTDRAINRGGRLGGTGSVVAKVSKPQQDFRFDIPTVGEETMKNLIEIKARGLVIEAGKTFLIEKAKFIRIADENNIAVVAMK